VVALVLASVIGGFIGQFIGNYLPDGAVKTLFQNNLEIGIGRGGVTVNEIMEPLFVNLYSISFAFGFLLRINFVSVLMVILVIIYFKWWYI